MIINTPLVGLCVGFFFLFSWFYTSDVRQSPYDIMEDSDAGYIVGCYGSLLE